MARSARSQLQRADERRRGLAPHAQSILGARAVDVALDGEDGVDARDRFQRDGRDRRRVLAAPRVGGDVGQLEELAPRMAPAQRLDDPPRLALGRIEAVVAAVGVGLEKAAPAREMAFGMLRRSVARGVEQRRRRSLSAERAVVADVDPDAARVGLAFGEDRNRGVVAMQALGG